MLDVTFFVKIPYLFSQDPQAQRGIRLRISSIYFHQINFSGIFSEEEDLKRVGDHRISMGSWFPWVDKIEVEGFGVCWWS